MGMMKVMSHIEGGHRRYIDFEEVRSRVKACPVVKISSVSTERSLNTFDIRLL
jgi:hypothetical protein